MAGNLAMNLCPANECQSDQATAASNDCTVPWDEEFTSIASNPLQAQSIQGGSRLGNFDGSVVLTVEEIGLLNSSQDIFEHIEYGGETAKIKIDAVVSKTESNPSERQAETMDIGGSYEKNVVGLENLMSGHKSCSVTLNEDETQDILFNLYREESLPNTMEEFSFGGKSSLSFPRTIFETSELPKNSIFTAMDQPLSFCRSAADAFDLDYTSSPGSLLLDTYFIQKFKPSSPLSLLPKYDSFFCGPTELKFTESQAYEIQQAEDTVKFLPDRNLYNNSIENRPNQVNHGQEESQTTSQFCQLSDSSQQNFMDNCFHLDSIERNRNNEKHNQEDTQTEGPAYISLNVEQSRINKYTVDFSKICQHGRSLTAGNFIDNNYLHSESSAALTTEWKDDLTSIQLIPLSEYNFEEQASSLGNAGSDIQHALNKKIVPTGAPLQRVGLKNPMDANKVGSNLWRSLSGFSSNMQISIPAKMCEEQTDGLHSLKRERPISMDILLFQDSSVLTKKQKMEVDGEESGNILQGKSDSEDPCLKHGLTAANSVLNILYPQIFFLLDPFIRANQGNERQEGVNNLLDSELQALAAQNKLPTHVASVLFSTASHNSIPFFSDLSLIRHIHHELLTELQSIESRACSSIKETITRFHFLYSNSSEAYHLKIMCLKSLCRQHRAMLLKSFRDNVLLQYSKETGSTYSYVQRALNSGMQELSSITMQHQETKLGPGVFTTSHGYKPIGASVCNLMSSAVIASSYSAGDEIINLSVNASQRKRLPKEACAFMDKYLLTHPGRIKRSEKEAIARLLKLTFKQVEIYVSNARARKFKH